MPPEPVPWDRKDFFRERKNERPESLGTASRWRGSPSHHGPREFARWGSGDFRRVAGHGKQGGWRVSAEENVHGFSPSQSGGKILEDDWPSVSRGEGKYGRNSRENRGSFTPREGKGHTWETSNGSLNAPGRLIDVNHTDQRSVDNVPNSDIVNAWNQLHLKGGHDNRIGLANGLGTGQRSERENSLDWKSLKWTRSGSLSSRGSGFSHSSSSKSLGGADSYEGKAELLHKNASPVQSPYIDGAAVMSLVSFEDTASRKKRRLGWGEGLAKYEKKKVDGPDVCVNKEGTVVCASNMDSNHSLGSNLVDRSPKVMGFSDCASPATPSSVACSSSPGVEDKSSGKAVNMDNDISSLCGLPNLGSQNFRDGFSFNLEKLDINLIVNLGSSLVDLLQVDDPSVHSSSARSSAMNKLLLCKSDVSKVLETTESEIDLLENELKLLKSESKNECLCPETYCSVHTEEDAKLCSSLGSNLVMVPRPPPLQLDTADTTLEECNREVCAGGEDIESPGTATSKFVESISLVTAASSSGLKCGVRSSELDASQHKNLVANLVNTSNEKDAGVSSHGDANLPLRIMNDRIPISNSVGFYADVDHKLPEAILTENNESANKAFEVFSKLLPSKQCDFTGVGNVASWRKDSFIKERFARRRQFLQFKERVITLKFKAFQYIWKEDVRVLSVRNYRVKSQKKSELSLRTANVGYQKHRSSIRSRFNSPAGNVSLVPTAEVINFTSKLLSDARVEHCRVALKMPALILDKKGKMLSRFISSNGLVEDPLAVEKERTLVNPWTLNEREIFMDKLTVFGKDFKKIASFLDHKTTADCVEFYYKNHKSDCFERTKKIDLGKQRRSVTNSMYMVASGKKWNREVNAASLEILGAASVMAAHEDNVTRSQQMCSGHVFRRGYNDSTSQVDDVLVERPGNFDIHGNERETVAADVLAGICSSLSPEAMSYWLTRSADHVEGHQERSYQNMISVVKEPSTSDVTQYIDNETCSDESSGEMDPADWTDREKSIFTQAVSSYGRDFAMIARCVRTRSMDQCKVFFSKARKCLGLDLLHPEPCNMGTPASDDANGGGGDAEDAFMLETGSTICSDKMGSMMDEDLPLSVMNLKQDESNPMKCMDLETDLNRSEGKDWMGPPESNNCNGVRTLIPDMCQTGVMAEQVSNFDKKSSVESERGFATVSTSVGEAVDLGASSSNTMIEKETGGEFSSGNSLEGEVLLPSLSDKVDRTHCADPRSHSGSMQDPNASGNARQLSVDTSSCSGSSPIPEKEQQVSPKLDSLEKPPVVFIPKEHGVSTSISVAQDSAVIQSEKMLVQDRSSSTLGVHASADKQGHKSVGQDDCQHHLSVHPSLEHVEYPQIITGYPLQTPTKKEMNIDSSCRQLSEVRNYCKSDENFTGRSLTQDCYLQKCNSSNPLCTVSEFATLSHKNDQIASYPSGHSRSLSDVGKPCGNGDFKLFGTILTHPSSSPKMDSIIHENDEKGIHHSRQSSMTPNLKFTSRPIADGSTDIMKFRNNYMGGLENVPIRSSGFLDGNRIQTSFSALPDSVRLQSTYPAAFANYPGSASKMDQQPLQAVMRNNERNVNGVSVFSPREIGGANGLLDYQLYRGPDGTKVLPFAVDTRQRQEALFVEIQKRNGYEAVSSSQQQARAMVGMNVVGRGGILVGGPCTGVSDPVAAIKMHYAKTDRYGGHGGGIAREQEWRGNGDIGR